MASLAELNTTAPNTHGLPDSALSSDPIHDPPRGRLKRRRTLSHSPVRASSPSRGHDRASGSRHRHHHRKHHRASSSRSLQPSPSPQLKKSRRRSDAEPDHTLRGRARNRSGSRSRSPILEGDDAREGVRRRRSQPPSRGWSGEGGMRRQRSYPNLYMDARRSEEKERQDSAAEEGESEGADRQGVASAVEEV